MRGRRRIRSWKPVCQARASDLVLWTVGATVRFYTGEEIVSKPHRFCRVTLDKCLLLSSI